MTFTLQIFHISTEALALLKKTHIAYESSISASRRISPYFLRIPFERTIF